MAKLTFVLEDGQEVDVPLAEHVTLGRGEDNDVVVDDDRISKRHAELARSADGSIELLDLNSTAGTFVNGERVRSHTVRHGDRLSFGPLTAVIDLEEHAPTNGTKAAPVPKAAAAKDAATGKPVKAGKIGTRKKDKGAKKEAAADKQTSLPPEELLARLNAEHQDTTARLDAEKTRLQAEVDAAEKELRDWQERSTKERSMHSTRVEALRAEEERLIPLKASVLEAESAHREWLDAIQALSVQHDEKSTALQQLTARHDQQSAEVQRLAAAEAAARHEIETLAAHKEQELAHLQQLREECEHDESHLTALRQQVSEMEAHSQESKDLAEVREDQVKSAEKKLEQLAQRRTQIEAHLKELTGTEEKLVQALARCREADANHTTLTTAIAALGVEQQRAEAAARELESRIGVLQEHHQQVTATTDAARATQQRVEETLRHTQAELQAHQHDLAARRTELAAETQRLDETKARRAEIAAQCQELAGTEQQLAEVRQHLASTEQQHAERKTAVAAAETQIVTHQAALNGLGKDEEATKGRIEVLHAREKDLRIELAALAVSERSERSRFEEMRQLTTEAEKEIAAQKEELTRSTATARRDLAELEAKLAPLRDWKDAMDQRYARLASLAEDSPEARDLWHEIEKEKAELRTLISAAPARSRAVPLREAVRQHGSAAAPDAETRASAGSSMLSGAGQEMTLKARVGRLRESVQREETRLDYLRQERARQEARGKSGPAGDAMLREQERQLETKIRRDEETYATLQRNLEAAGLEEEKRRERITDMERKLAELRADIAEAERQRSELRQQADLAQTELRNYEAVLDRMMKKPSD